MKNIFPRVTLLLLLVLSVTLTCLAQDPCDQKPGIPVGPNPPGLVAAPWYFVWKAGNPGDQSAVVPGQISGLETWGMGAATIPDFTFAKATGTAIMNRDINGKDYSTIPLVYVFGECFGGGMIDDLDALRLKNPISIVTAAFFNQRATYPRFLGNHVDFTRVYMNALLSIPNPTAQLLAAQASGDDPWGWNPNPNPPRIGELQGKETPEYYSKANGDNIPLVRDPAEVNSVILWAGQPEMEDDHQMARLLFALVERGYDPENIVMLFGSGKPKNSPDLVSTMQGLWLANPVQGQTHLRAASLKQFQFVLDTWALPANLGNPPRYFLFISLDHGCNNAFNPIAWSKDGDQTAPIEDGGDWGAGESDYPIQPARR